MGDARSGHSGELLAMISILDVFSRRDPVQTHHGMTEEALSGHALRDDCLTPFSSSWHAYGQDLGLSLERTRARSRIGALRDDYVSGFRAGSTG
ncbi:hypothetical protein PHOSAC3_120038 [Mesotoga infera]|nr:hypothetical protein PHOSAC3_120038 [Mesotoga infera]